MLTELPSIPKLKSFVSDYSKYTAVTGSFGSAKTWHGAKKSFRLIQDFEGSKGLIGGISWSGHCKATLLPYLEEQFQGEIPTHFDSETKCLNVMLPGRYPNKVFFAGLNDADSYKRIMHASFDWIWIDEATHIHPESFRWLFGRLRGKVGPKIMFVTTIPDLVSHWLKTELDNSRHHWKVWKVTAEDNIFLPEREEYVETLKSSYQGGSYQIFGLGEWATSLTGFFKGIPNYQHVNLNQINRFVSIDPAKSKQGDFFCVVTGYVDSDLNLVIDSVRQSKGLSDVEATDMIESIVRSSNSNQVLFETNGVGQFLFDMVSRKVPWITPVYTTENKVERARELASAWFNKKVFLNLDGQIYKDTLNQFLQFPESDHDDIVDCCSLAFNQLIGVKKTSGGSVMSRSLS